MDFSDYLHVVVTSGSEKTDRAGFLKKNLVFQKLLKKVNIMETERENGNPNGVSESQKIFQNASSQIWSIDIPSTHKSWPKIGSEKGPNLHFWIFL